MPESSFIIGSGPSLLDLSQDEVAYLNAHPRTLSLNQYLLHWEVIGVVPKCHMMADGNFPAIKLFIETQDAIKRLGQPVRYYVSHWYLQYFPRTLKWKDWKYALRKRLEIRQKYDYMVPWVVHRKNLVAFSQVKEPQHQNLLDDSDWYWARSLEEPLYFFRGTLTSAINLAAIVWPGKDIKLLGVDLNSYGYFFDPQRGQEAREDLHKFNEQRLDSASALHHQKSHILDTHATAVEYERKGQSSLGGIQTAFPKMHEVLASDGQRLFCCNPKSLLVSNEICEFRSVIP